MDAVAVFLAPGFEEIEALTSVDYLRRAGVFVVTVSVPSEGAEDATFTVTGSHRITVIADDVLDSFLEKTKKGLPDAIFLPGGLPGATNLAASAPLVGLVKDMERAGKLVASMCASPAVVLSKAGVLAGRKWTCYPGMNESLAEYCGGAESAARLCAGAEHVALVPFVYDKNVLTGRGPGTAEQFAMKFVEILTDSETAKKVHDSSCQR